MVSLLYPRDAGLGRGLWEPVVRDTVYTGAVLSRVDQGQTGVARAPELRCPGPVVTSALPAGLLGPLGSVTRIHVLEVEGSEPAVRAWGMCQGPGGRMGPPRGSMSCVSASALVSGRVGLCWVRARGARGEASGGVAAGHLPVQGGSGCGISPHKPVEVRLPVSGTA